MKSSTLSSDFWNSNIQEARAAGCRTSSEADRYLEQKRREADEGGHRKENSHVGPSSQESLSFQVSSDSFGTYSTTTSAGQANSSTDFDLVSVSGAQLLSEPVSVQLLLFAQKSEQSTFCDGLLVYFSCSWSLLI